MAFIRSYTEQGHPFPRRTLRAGQLTARPRMLGRMLDRAQPSGFKRLTKKRIAMLRRQGAAGDPFRFRMPKFVRKLSLKKVVKAVGQVAKVALPIAAPFIPGVGPFLAPLLVAAFSGGGSPDSPAPELVQQPEPVGTIGEVARGGYMVPGVEVTARRYRAPKYDVYEEPEYEEPEYEEREEYEEPEYEEFEEEE